MTRFLIIAGIVLLISPVLGVVLLALGGAVGLISAAIGALSSIAIPLICGILIYKWLTNQDRDR